MTTYQLPYGSRHMTVNIPDHFHTDLIAPKLVQPTADPMDLVNQALDKPFGKSSLDHFSGARSAAVAINDKTRPVPHEVLLPPLLSRLEAMGIKPGSISLLIATGTHPPMPTPEFGKVVPREILGRYPVYSHDCDAPDLVSLGETSIGTPIYTNRRFIEADLRIVVGNIEPHHFMGYSGGVKTASVGLGSRTTINKNHALLTHPLAVTAHYEDNPMRVDVEEIGSRIGVHFALNAIMNTDKQIVRVLAGDPVEVMLTGIPITRQICQVPIDQAYDVVIAAPGGHPKDINLYQSQKALTHAAMMTRAGGTIVLLAACPDGSGSAGYERAMQGLTSFKEVFDHFSHSEFEVGPHKAYLVARDASRVNIMMVSEMTPEKVRSLLLTPVDDLDASLTNLFTTLPAASRVAILPYGTITIPSMHNQL